MMGPITRFLTNAYSNGMFVFASTRTPEALLKILGEAEGADDNIRRFLAHASKTAFLNLTAIEILAGKCKQSKLTCCNVSGPARSGDSRSQGMGSSG
jgi:hypothetical protein